ncbi:MAG: hypothetical protein O7G86_08225 [Gammaproteobacteria bacterium]|nr:hypothetical protein [Gammaproteobacteria bacterium]
MLTIRKRQMKVLVDRQGEVFAQRVIEYLTDEYADLTAELSHDELGTFVSTSLEKIEKYGITKELHTVQLVLFYLVAGLSFDTEPQGQWAKTILENENIPEGSRVLQVRSRYQRLPAARKGAG